MRKGKGRKKQNVRLFKYRRGIPWMPYEKLWELVRDDQLSKYGRTLTQAEAKEAVDNMRKISDAAKHANRDDIIIKHNPHTNRWASYETADDRIILDAKGKD